MGLDSFVSDSDEDDERDKDVCPVCEERGKYMVHVQYKCTNDDCDTISWYNNRDYS